MRVGCPHCHAAYNIDDRRVPATGLNVRCPKCRDTFPVRPAAAAGGARRSSQDGIRVPLPATAAPVASAVRPRAARGWPRAASRPRGPAPFARRDAAGERASPGPPCRLRRRAAPSTAPVHVGRPRGPGRPRGASR